MSSIAVKQKNSGQSLPKWMEALCYALTAGGLLVLGAALFFFLGGKSSENTAVKTVAADMFYEKHTVTQQTLEQLSSYLKTKFSVGDWRFINVEQHKDRIRAYILIPQRLDFDGAHQHAYVRNSVCPTSTNTVWDQLSPQQLEIHLYTNVKNSAEVTRCR